MKTYKIFGLMLAGMLILGSCEREVIGEIYDGSGPSLLSFEETSKNLPVLLGNGTGTADLTVEVSTLSNTDRNFNVSVVTEGTTATSDLYTVPASVTIPANSYEGILTVTGNETDNLTTSAETLVIQLSEQNNVNFTNQQTTVNIFLVCPVPSDYLVGEYDLIVTQSAGDFGFPIFRGPANTSSAGRDTLVTLEVGNTQTEREFDVIPRSGGGSNARTFVLSLVCGELGLINTIGDPINAGLNYGPGDEKTTYDLSDDSLIFVNFTGNVDSAFGGAATQGEFVLQKR